jgi:hypothetical protein
LSAGGPLPVGRRYRYADVTVRSTLPLAELSPLTRVGVGSSEISFDQLASPRERAAEDWIHHWKTGDGAPVLSLARIGEGYLLRFPGLADFAISADGGRIGAWPTGETDAETLRHLLLDQVLPRLLAHKRRLVLHAGAIRAGTRAIAFVSESGGGKSTLTASFHEAGCPLLSDDGLMLTRGEGGVLALPTYHSLRLWPEALAGLLAEAPAMAPMAHYSSKRRVFVEDSVDGADRPVPLAALYVLVPEAEAGGATSLSRLSQREACMAIIGNAFQLDVTDRRRAAGLLAAAGDIAEHLPAFALSFPRDFACLPEVRAAIVGQSDQWAGVSVSI